MARHALRFGVVKAIDLVRRVVQLGSSLRERRRGGDTALAERREAPASRLGIAETAALRVVQVTTVLARQMRDLPLPKPRPAERILLSAAAAQLRVIADATGLGEERAVKREDLASDATPRPTNKLEKRGAGVEAAVAELVRETLTLVDRVLAQDAELAPDTRARTFPSVTDALSSPNASKLPDRPPEPPTPPAQVTKVRF